MNQIKPKKSLFKRVTKKIHLWLGLATTIPLFVIAVTGIILSTLFLVDDVEKKFAHDEAFFSNKSEIANSVSQIIDFGKNYEIDGYKLALVRFPEGKSGEITMRFLDSNRHFKQIILQKYPNEDLILHKIENGTTFEKWILKLHHTFLFEETGETIAGFFGIILCVMCISGLIIWLPKLPVPAFHLKNISVPKFSLKGRALNINLHKSFGIWLFAVLLIVAFTGTFLAFTKQFNQMVSMASPVRDFKKSDVQYQPNYTVDFQTLVQNVVESTKNHAIISIQFPQKNEPYRFTIRPENYSEGRHGISVFVASDGKVLEVRNPKDYSKGENFLMWLGMLHKGVGLGNFGIVWRIIQIVCGIGVILFAYTGIMIWVKKPKKP
jgi:uncharacterized iron-regulated membrane protein